MDLIDRISRLLKEEKGIVCKPNWLGACIEWIIQEEQMNRNIDYRRLQSLVYEQWLLSDLCVSSMECLPAIQEKCELNGPYLLQVNSIIDVGVSAYSQLQKLKGQEVDATDSDKAKKNMEAKPTRMLLLQLTDWSVEISAMEYHTIPFLSKEISPGVKVKLTGPIECRLGMLLLTSPNVTVLGGEVESLLSTNNQKHILSCMIEKSSSNSTVDHARPTTTPQHSSDNSVPIKGERINLDISVPQPVTTRTCETDYNSGLNNDPLTHTASNNVLDELDDDLDAAMMDVDLDMFDDNSTSENQAEQGKFESPVASISNVAMEISMNRTPSLKTISDILTIVNQNYFHGTVRIKAKVHKVAGKLQYTSDLQWCLTVILTDDSHKQLTTKLSNEVLEILIGFTAKEFKEKIEPNKSVPSIKNRGVEGFQRCHYSLAHLGCYMDVSFIPNSTPIITKLLDKLSL